MSKLIQSNLFGVDKMDSPSFCDFISINDHYPQYIFVFGKDDSFIKQTRNFKDNKTRHQK